MIDKHRERVPPAPTTVVRCEAVAPCGLRCNLDDGHGVTPAREPHKATRARGKWTGKRGDLFTGKGLPPVEIVEWLSP